MKFRWMICASLMGTVAFGPAAVLAVDIPVPAKSHLIKQDRKNGFVAKQAKISNKPLPKGTTFPLPTSDPTVVGGQLRFFLVDAPGTFNFIDLPAGNWKGLGNPAGSKGYKYKGAGTTGDPCKTVVVKEKVITATCKGPGAFDSPTPYSLPVGPEGAGWELIIGDDRYCAESSADTLAQIKKNDGAKGLFKAVKALAPAVCPAPGGGATPTPTPSQTPTPTPEVTPTPTPPYGSASQAFLRKGESLF